MKLAAAIVILATAWPATAAADLCDKAIKVEAGAKAPCEGVLWPNAVTAKVLRCPGQLRTCQAQAKRDAAVAAADQAEAAARAKRDLDVAQAATQAAEARAETWRKLADDRGRLLDLPQPPQPKPPAPAWHDRPAVWYVGGILTGAALVAGAWYVKDRISP